MAWLGRSDEKGRPNAPVLAVEQLDVHYGRAHVLQGVSLTLERGVLAIVGRNGMGKTTLCNAITGLVPASGSIQLFGEEICGLAPHRITQRGIAYVPQGRRVWPSLSVDETLRLVAPKTGDVERVYEMFPRLAERKNNGGAQLSGGEAQMLAIGRALLLEPKLLVMDEPTEGLAPMIVEQVVEALRGLAAESEIAVLLIEQNLGVAIDVADRVARDGQRPDRARAGGRRARRRSRAAGAAARAARRRERRRRRGRAAGAPRGRRRRRSSRCAAPTATARLRSTTSRRARCAASTAGTRAALPLRWPTSRASHRRRGRRAWHARPRRAPSRRDRQRARRGCSTSRSRPAAAAPPTSPAPSTPRGASSISCASASRSSACASSPSTSRPRGKPSTAAMHPREVARHHPEGEGAVFTGDRGSAVTAMALAFARFVADAQRPRRPDRRRRLGRHLARDRRHARAADRRAEGDGLDHGERRHAALRRPERHLHDVFGHRRAGHQPHQRAGARQCRPCARRHDRRTRRRSRNEQAGDRPDDVRRDDARACRRVAQAARDTTTTASSSTPPASAASRWKSSPTRACSPASIDVSTTEIADEIAGGVLSAGPTRLDVVRAPRAALRRLVRRARHGQLRRLGHGARALSAAASLYRHNPTVTLMRTTAENAARSARSSPTSSTR